MLNGIDNIEGLTDEQKEAINGLGAGLVQKNAELLEKLGQQKEQGGQSAAELENLRLFKQNADQKILEEGQQYEEAKQNLIAAHSEELAKANEINASSQAQLRTLLIDSGLSAALDGVNINKDLKAGAVAMLQSGATITEGKAMIGDKSLSDAVKEWSETDAGKAFCMAPNNSGGNANGGGSNPSGEPQENKAAKEAYDKGDINGFLSASLKAKV